MTVKEWDQSWEPAAEKKNKINERALTTIVDVIL
jgi:hypothetical protein